MFCYAVTTACTNTKRVYLIPAAETVVEEFQERTKQTVKEREAQMVAEKGPMVAYGKKRKEFQISTTKV